MKQLKLLFIEVLIFFFGISLAFAGEIIFKEKEDHPHRYPNTQTIGDYHASFSINHTKGEIILYITDSNEDPKYLTNLKLDAKITLPSGKVKKVKFLPTRHEPGSKRKRAFSFEYVLQEDWLKNVHKFNLFMEIPIMGKTYPVSFDYQTSTEEHKHHKHTD